MKRRMTITIALVLSIVFVSLMSSDSSVNAAGPQRYVADTGMVHLAPNEFLRVMAVNTAAQRSRVTSLTVTFTAQVSVSTCSGGVCIHNVTSQTTTDPVKLNLGQAASHDIVGTPGSSAVRGVVSIDSPDVQVNAFVIDSGTGAVRGFLGGVVVAAADVN